MLYASPIKDDRFVELGCILYFPNYHKTVIPTGLIKYVLFCPIT